MLGVLYTLLMACVICGAHYVIYILPKQLRQRQFDRATKEGKARMIQEIQFKRLNNGSN